MYSSNYRPSMSAYERSLPREAGFMDGVPVAEPGASSFSETGVMTDKIELSSGSARFSVNKASSFAIRQSLRTSSSLLRQSI
jgi:hypothetical protein